MIADVIVFTKCISLPLPYQFITYTIRHVIKNQFCDENVENVAKKILVKYVLEYIQNIS